MRGDRKCPSIAYSSNLKQDHAYFEQEKAKEILIQWISDLIETKFDGFILSFMFHPLPGGKSAVLEQMRRDIERVYARLAKRMFRHPNSCTSYPNLPRLFAVPDVPVPKREKSKLRDVVINDGVHIHAALLTPSVSRISEEPLDVHFAGLDRWYRQDTRLRSIHIKPIIVTPEKAADYVFKSVGRRFSWDDLLILPKTRSEMPSKRTRSWVVAR